MIKKFSNILLVPASLLVFAITVELLCMGWLSLGGKPRRPYQPTQESPFFSWKEVQRLSLEDQGPRGDKARELIKLGILKYEQTPAKRNLSLLFEAGDYSGLTRNKKHNPRGDKSILYQEEIILRGLKSKRIKARYLVDIDHHNRRSLGLPVSPEKENVVFMGCSFTFGDSLNVEDTFPFLIAQSLPVNAYNIGFSGGNPVKSYVKLVEEGASYLGDLNGKPTTFVYTFIDDQMRRALGTSRWLVSMKGMPKVGHQVYLSGDELKYFKRSDAGFFDFIWFKALFGISSFARVTGIEIPMIGDDQLELFTRTIVGIKKEASKLAPLKKFLFVFYPGSDIYAPQLIPFLKKHGIEFLDLSDIPPKLLNGHETVPGDLHPSGEMNRIFAHFLSLELKKSSGYP